jgi:hypothetical protein
MTTDSLFFIEIPSHNGNFLHYSEFPRRKQAGKKFLRIERWWLNGKLKMDNGK